jgi:hypothetical protein
VTTLCTRPRSAPARGSPAPSGPVVY